MEKKVCSKCKEEKELSEFYRYKYGPCKLCFKEYREKNKDKIKLYQQEYGEKNKEKRNIRLYNRRQYDPIHKLSTNIKSRIRESIKRKGYSKKTGTYQILGCSFEEFKTHIESQWEEWMNWNNHGLYNGEENYGWDLDHIIPLSSGKSEEDIIRLNHYSNIQPLCSYINRDVKRDIIDWVS